MGGLAMERIKQFVKRRTVVGILLGQFLSLIITSTGFSSSELARRGVNAPTSQSFLNYVLLALVYGAVMLWRKKPLKARWYYYILLGLVDVEANFLVVKAYQYTSLTSVMLLDCWSIPCVVLLTWAFLKTKYKYKKFAGVVICVAGLVMDIFSDVHAQDREDTFGYLSMVEASCISMHTSKSCNFSELPTSSNDIDMKASHLVCVAPWKMDNLIPCLSMDLYSLHISSGSNPLKGDLLVIAGSTLYAVSNVSEEFLVKNADRIELMAMLGLFGAIISACQISILERNELRSIHWTAGAALPFVGFSAAMFVFYSLVPILLKISGSAMLNLSLLTSDMWAVLIRIFAYHEKVDWLYFLAFAAVAVGLLVYSWGQKVEDKAYLEVADEPTERSKRFDEEANLGNPGQETNTGNEHEK
ncbi:hypothetical protein Ancab_032427 [Ancistrocladus abbreviatus]